MLRDFMKAGKSPRDEKGHRGIVGRGAREREVTGDSLWGTMRSAGALGGRVQEA